VPTLVHVCDPGLRVIEDLAEVPALLAAGTRMWVDSDGEDPAIAAFLTDVLGIHPLAVEDILVDRPTPKVEDYGSYLYVVAHGVTLHPEDLAKAETIEIDVVLSQTWVFTHHRGVCRATQAVQDDLRRSTRTLERGPAYVAHAMLDHLVDYYLPVMDALDERVDALEHEVVESTSQDVVQRIFSLKQGLLRLRRIAVHQREVLQRISRGEFDEIPPAALPFYRDVYDHFVRVADLTDSYRDLLSGALDAYLSVVSNRMNEVMKRLTLVATVMMPLTFIAGVYGMNFDHMPELRWSYGYAFAWGLMILVAIAMILWFRRRKWM
jgi:magnesium transporter